MSVSPFLIIKKNNNNNVRGTVNVKIFQVKIKSRNINIRLDRILAFI